MLSHINYKTGRISDMKKITDYAHNKGALVVWDLSHSVGVMPMDLHNIGVDFAVGCTYKHLNGGPGAPGFLYVRNDLIEKVTQPLSGWLGHSDPFAFDREYKPANNINKYLSLGFKENQIYRIDHYLGKEAVQNLLALRFANTIFEQSWSSSAIDHIQISVAEDLGVEGRGGYYDKTGALRDMIQNHLLQILCLIAMEPPVSISSESVRDEKLKVLKSLAFFDENSIKSDSVRARYTEGLSKGQAACSYIDEDGVDSKNKTETFVALKVLINNWRWSGVPFYLRTGKRMESKTSEITVRYKRIPHNIFSKDNEAKTNQLVLRIHPDEGIDLKLNTKEPGVSGFNLEELPLDMNLDDYYELGHQDCYERLLLDVINGNPALFVRKDEVDASWKWIDNIIDLWKKVDMPIEEYNSGSWGPVDSDLLLKRDFRSWKNGGAKKS